MSNTQSSLYQASQSLPLSTRADLARSLISANDLYRISNSPDYEQREREEALEKSAELTALVLTHLPNDVAALNLSARIELDKHNLQQANELLNRAEKVDPKNVNTRLNIGYLCLAQKQPEKAEALFKKVLELEESNEKAFSGIALAKLNQKDYVGAFTHYKRLIELGLDSDITRAYFLDAAEQLNVDFYQEDLEELLVTAFRWEHQDLNKLASMSASLLIHKYDLENENSAINMEDLLKDELFLQASQYCLMASLPVEELIVAIRQSIMQEVSITRSLRDELLPVVISIGQYAARTDYTLMQTHEEELETTSLIHEIKQLTDVKWSPEDLAGALMILAMYEDLYTTPFSFKLLGVKLEDWPLGMQSLMHAALYELSEEHQYQYQLYGNSVTPILNNEIRRCADRWTHLPNYSRKSLYQALCAELDTDVIPKRFEEQTLNILVLGSNSGKRALLLANSFLNLNVVAVDTDLLNVAYTKMKAEEHEIDNLSVLHASYDLPLFNDQSFDIIEFGNILNHVDAPEQVIRTWLDLLVPDGIARLSLDTQQASDQVKVITQLVQARKLSATTENIRHLRHAIAEENGSGLWEALLKDTRFYSGGGCKQLFFNEFNQGFDLQATQQLLKDSGLDFIGFADLDKMIKERVNPMSPYNLMAWHVMDQDNRLFSNAYQLYVTRSNS